MDSKLKFIVDIDSFNPASEIGMKAFSLSKIKKNGFLIPRSIILTSHSYEFFMASNGLKKLIEVELGRKSMINMRWEELWDCALRIRNLLMRADVPQLINVQLKKAILDYFGTSKIAIRSSSSQEDMHNASFAGLYDSYLGRCGYEQVIESVIKVWCSLWSDRSLLYRKEIQLDPMLSSMAVLLQELVPGKYSGVSFSRCPNDSNSKEIHIEVVAGFCDSLVDGTRQPDSFIVKRYKLHIASQNRFIENKLALAGLNNDIIREVASVTLRLEEFFGNPVDVEWTWANDKIIVLQVRPIIYNQDPNKKRLWYLSLTPVENKMDKLFIEIEDKLIPYLKNEGKKMAEVNLLKSSNNQLADIIETRLKILSKCRIIYKEKFIPFAHGVRQFGQSYNDCVKPHDAYEFIEILQSEDRIAKKRQQAIFSCNTILSKDINLSNWLNNWLENAGENFNKEDIKELSKLNFGKDFINRYQNLKNNYLDITLDSERWCEHDDVIIQLIINYNFLPVFKDNNERKKILINNYLKKSKDIKYAKHLLSIGRISWKLRDDDNLLLSKIESQFHLALQEGKLRLIAESRLLNTVKVLEYDAENIVNALKNNSYKIYIKTEYLHYIHSKVRKVKARQLKGQPAVPGLASGVARHIKNFSDIKKFRPGDIILCEAVDPNITHLVPLACGIVESRGGMLIHGVIIARELSIPCVNGIDNLLKEIQDGDFITIDGTMGIIIIGKPEF